MIRDRSLARPLGVITAAAEMRAAARRGEWHGTT